MRTAIDLKRVKAVELSEGDTIAVPEDLMYTGYDYKSKDNIATRLISTPRKHHEYDEYWVLETSYGVLYVMNTDWVGLLKERVIYK